MNMTGDLNFERGGGSTGYCRIEGPSVIVLCQGFYCVTVKKGVSPLYSVTLCYFAIPDRASPRWRLSFTTCGSKGRARTLFPPATWGQWQGGWDWYRVVYPSCSLHPTSLPPLCHHVLKEISPDLAPCKGRLTLKREVFLSDSFSVSANLTSG